MKQPELLPQNLSVEARIKQFVAGTLGDVAKHLAQQQESSIDSLRAIGRPIMMQSEYPLDADTSRRYSIEVGPNDNQDGDELPSMHYTLTQVDYQQAALGGLSRYEREGMFAAIIEAERENYFADNFLNQLRCDVVEPEFTDVQCRSELATEYQAVTCGEGDDMTVHVNKEVSASYYYADILMATTGMTQPGYAARADSVTTAALTPNDQQAEEIGVRDLALMSEVLFRFGLPGGQPRG